MIDKHFERNLSQAHKKIELLLKIEYIYQFVDIYRMFDHFYLCLLILIKQRK